MTIDIEYAGKTHIGTRQKNQDYLGHAYSDPWHCFVVTDGCGAYKGSGLAAKYFCDMLLNCLPDFIESLNHSPEQAVTAMFSLAGEHLDELTTLIGSPQAQTTCAAVWLNEHQIVLAHIGDSRIYRISKQQYWHTKDHSLAQTLIDKGQINAQQALLHSSRHILSRTIGNHQPLKPSLQIAPALQPDEALILCTDGFWANSQHSEFLKLARATNLQKVLNSQIANLVKTHQKRNRSLDNITVQIIRCKQTGVKTLRSKLSARLQQVFS